MMWPKIPRFQWRKSNRSSDPEVALLVDGVTKLTQIKFSNVEDRQAENLRKMLLAMSQDVRVMIIKLCDRLHNMRTGDAWPEQKRRDKALETMEVYAPIAHRWVSPTSRRNWKTAACITWTPLGMRPSGDLLNKHGDEFLHTVCHTIARHLAENGIPKATIATGSRASTASTARCICRTRILRKSTMCTPCASSWKTCRMLYTAAGLIHDMYHPLPNRFKDYISLQNPTATRVCTPPSSGGSHSV